MNKNLFTRLNFLYLKIIKNLNKVFQKSQSILPFALFTLLCGFFFGNLFGTFISYITFYNWLIILLFVSFVEFINFFIYTQSIKIYNKNTIKSYIPTKFGWKLLNYFKIGLLLGLFVDAFKVGS